MKNMKFEEAILRLEDITAELESGELTLDESIAKYEEALKLLRICNKTLEMAELKVKILTEKEDGTITDADFTAKDEA